MTPGPGERARLRGVERRSSQLVVASARASAGTSLLAVVVSMGAAWMATWLGGGSQGVLVHLFYVPVLVAATRFGEWGALVVGVLAGLAAGPGMPFDVAAGTDQAPESWALRLCFFVAIGLTVAFLSERSVVHLGQVLADARIAAELERGLADGQFHVVYQPQFELATGWLTGVEALARWNDPARGTVPPAMFIPDAERTGLIRPIGARVLEIAIAQAAAWRRRLPPDSSFSVAVNLSAIQLADPDLPGELAGMLARSGLPPEALHLEITESAVIADLDLAADRLGQLRELGVRIAVDDFGTGQSSLAYLHRLPIDIIKIDKQFVQAVDDDRAAALTAGVIALAESLGATVIAEGIETEHQADTLRFLSCERGQGFYYAPPSRPHAVDRILALAVEIPGAGASVG